MWIMPTCGALLWVMTTSAPAATRSAITFAERFTAAFCSGSVVPRALCPSATTIFFLFIGRYLSLQFIDFDTKKPGINIKLL
jgi:hypothetical protein